MNLNDAYCNKCPDNAECNTNGSFISVFPGFWREDYFSTNILECFIQEACLGNECNIGYKGPLCDTCSGDYFKQPQRGCVKCEAALTSYFLMAGVHNFFLLFYFFFLDGFDYSVLCFVHIKNKYETT